MSDIQMAEETEKELSRTVIQVFGAAVVEFEVVLFQKVLHYSAKMLLTEEMFIQHLEKMEEKGFIKQMQFHGQRCWKKLVSEDDIIDEELTQEEIQQILKKGHEIAAKSDRVLPSASDQLVTEARNTAQDILHLLKADQQEDPARKKTIDKDLFNLIEALRRALAESEEHFLDLASSLVPTHRTALELILKAKGTDVLLPALRIIEYGLKAS
jgi:hypothetical protein